MSKTETSPIGHFITERRDKMLEILEHTIEDSVKLIPFLFLTYLLMEFIEHKTKEKTKETIKKSGKFGPLIGAILGIIPQCGFSVSATNFYSARVITLGTLIAVYLSTSDEMLPIFLSEGVAVDIILKILAIKLIIGMIAGFLIDLVINLKNKGKNVESDKIVDLCEKEHCHCEHGIFKSALKHTANIFIFIFLITFVINIAIHIIGEDNIARVMLDRPILGPIISGIIGLIPNCASSVIITQMYLENIISVGTMISGLLVGAGVGLAVLFRTNKGIKENIRITVLLYSIGVISGIILELIGLNI